MPDKPTITIDMDKKCVKCGHKGACQNGLCMACNADEVLARAKRREAKDA